MSCKMSVVCLILCRSRHRKCSLGDCQWKTLLAAGDRGCWQVADGWEETGNRSHKMKLAPIYHRVLTLYFLCFSECIYSLAQITYFSGAAINAVDHINVFGAPNNIFRLAKLLLGWGPPQTCASSREPSQNTMRCQTFQDPVTSWKDLALAI